MQAHQAYAVQAAATATRKRAAGTIAMPALYRAALGPFNTDRYLAFFERQDDTGRNLPGWNAAAAFFTLGWMVFRQLWLPALVYLAALEGVALVAFALGQQWLKLPPPVLGGLALAVFGAACVLPGLYGDAVMHAEMRKKINRALAASPNLAQAAELLARQAPTRRRLAWVAAVHALLAAAALVLWLAFPEGMEKSAAAGTSPAGTAPAAVPATPSASVPAAPEPAASAAGVAAPAQTAASEAAPQPQGAAVPGPQAASASAPEVAASQPAPAAAPAAASSAALEPAKPLTAEAKSAAAVASQAASLQASAAAPDASASAATAPSARPAASSPAATPTPSAQPAAKAPSAGASSPAQAPAMAPASSQPQSAPAAKAAGSPGTSAAAAPHAPQARTAAARTTRHAAKPAAAPLPATAGESDPPVAQRRLYINVGLFGEPANARRAMALLQTVDVPASTAQVRSATTGRMLTRVRAGPFRSSSEANDAARRVLSVGLEAAPAQN